MMMLAAFAAFAVAFDCARGSAVHCTNTYASTVSGRLYADSNARDGQTTVEAVEPAGLSPASGEVTVRTLSREGTQDAVTLFMGNVLGQSTAQVRAAATARWGGTGTATGLPLAIPKHRWEAVAAWQKATYPLLTNAQGLFPEDGPFPPLPAPQTVFTLGGAPDYPSGSFGWIDHPQNVHPYCQVSLTVDTPAVGNGSAFSCDHPDASGTGQESAAFRDYALSRTHPIPVFGSHNNLTGSNARYHIYSWAAIRVTGYRFTGSYTWPSATAVCGSGNCIRGWLSTFAPRVGTPGGPSTGIQTVQLVR